MIAGLGTTELLIILVVVLLIFGVGRIGKLGGEMGTAVQSFRKGIRETSTAPEKEESNG